MNQARFTEAYKNARYELIVVDRSGVIVPERCFPWRFDRILTAEEMEDGSRNGFGKYAVPMFEEEKKP